MLVGPPSHPEGGGQHTGWRWHRDHAARLWCMPREIFICCLRQPPCPKHYLAGVDASRQVPSTEHGAGEQVSAQGTSACLLAEQWHLCFHHHVGCWPLC